MTANSTQVAVLFCREPAQLLNSQYIETRSSPNSPTEMTMRLKRWLLYTAAACAIAAPSALTSTTPVLSAPPQFNREEQANIDIYRLASPSVVTIEAGSGTGSGSIVSEDGLVLTNEHVVRSSRRGRVTVTTAEKKRYPGYVIATNRQHDLALVRLQTSDRFPSLKLADRDGIQVGQQVYAIGSPFGLSGTLTTGILSRIGDDGNLQTDATLNPGNSGGPLLNSRGELIGVNKAILVGRRRGVPGIGIATNGLIAQDFIAQHRHKTIDSAPVGSGNIARRADSDTPRLGITVDARSLIIQSIQRGSLADRVGLRPGDRLLAINGRRLRHASQVVSFLDRKPQSAVFTVARNRRLANLRVRF